MNEKRDIAIVGMACVFPRAANLRRYWSNLVNGVDAVEEIPSERWQCSDNFTLPPDHEAHITCTRGAFIPADLWFDPRKFGVMPNAVLHGDPDQFLMIDVVDRALADAGIAQEAEVRRRMDLIIGRGGYPTTKHSELMMRSQLFNTILELIDRRYPDMLAGGRRDELETYLRSTLSPNQVEGVATAIPNIAASRAANRLDIRGSCYTVDAACASSLMALDHAVTSLRNGQSDAAVAGGVFLNHQATFSHVFTRLGALSKEGMIRPFDRRADGLVIGDGAGAVVLKRLADAIDDGDRIYAVVKGIGSSGDGRSVDVLAPSSEGQVEALRRAHSDAEVDPDSIGYLELHGTGTVAGDDAEINTIKTFYGTRATPPTERCMGSVKSMIGHTMPAAGVASLIKTALSLSNKMIPASLHCEQPRPELAEASFFMNTQLRPWVHNGSGAARRAGVNTFGFGGVNVHAILEEVEPAQSRRRQQVPVPHEIESVVTRPNELAVFSANTTGELIERLQRLSAFLDHDQTDCTLADIAASLIAEVEDDHDCRLAIVCSDQEELHAKIDVCIDQLAQSSPQFAEESGIHYGTITEAPTGKVAFIFPGMGFPGLIGNYPDHLQELCLNFPEVRAEFDLFEQRDRHPEDTVPTSSVFWPPTALPEEYRQKLRRRLAPPRTDDNESSETLRPEERYLAAMGVTLSNWVSWKVLQKFDVHVDMIAGQSQGEMAAVCAAGVADFQATAPAYWKVLNVDWAAVKGERMAFAWVSEERLTPLLEAHPGTHIAIHIAPEAIIFGGPAEDLDSIAEALREEQVLVQILPYPPIHTPRLSYLRDELLETLRDGETHLGEQQIDLYSSITADRYPTEPEAVRETLLLNLDRPLRIWQTMQRMYKDGARIFVQAGGGHVASSLETLLPGCDDIMTIALDLDEVNPITQLHHLLGTLFCVGVPLQLAPLHEDRRTRHLDFDNPQPPAAPPVTAVHYRLDWSPLLSEHVPPPREVEPAHEANGHVINSDVSQQDADGSVAQSFSPHSSRFTGGAFAGEQPAADEPAAAPEQTTVSEPSASELSLELGMPYLGELLHFVPGQELVMERNLDAHEDLFLHDHSFVYAPGIKPVEHCLPVQPMTFGIEQIAETAALLSPGKILIGMENLRASRWIGLKGRPQEPMRVEAKTVPSTIAPDVYGNTVQSIEVTVHFQDLPSLSGTVLFADAYRQDVHFDLADCSGDGPWPLTAEEVYSQRRMFHGPRLQCISGLTAMGNPGFSGELMVMPKDEIFRSHADPNLLTDPCLLDGVGQVVGLWLQLHDWSVLPTGLEKLEIYGPTPPVGTSVPIRCELTDFEMALKRTKCNIEIEDGQGGVWMRIVGWSDWIFKWSPRFAQWIRNPFDTCVCDEVDLPSAPDTAVCCIMTKKQLKKSDLDRAARIGLSLEELDEMERITDDGRVWQHVASRLAAKDAIRLWRSRKDGSPGIHPALLPISHDSTGRPVPGWQGNPEGVHISLAHNDKVAVAIAHGAPVGIDVEPINHELDEMLAQFATEEEITLLETARIRWPDDAWSTRLWCAKEAVSKLLGTGMEGRPKDYQVIDLEDAAQMLIHHARSNSRYRVGLSSQDGYVIAWTHDDRDGASQASTGIHRIAADQTTLENR